MDKKHRITKCQIDFETIVSIVDFRYLSVKTDEQSISIEALYFYTIRLDVGEFFEYIEYSQCRYRIIPTRAMEKKIIEHLRKKSLSEDRPDRAIWQDMQEEEKSNFRYFKIEKFKSVFQNAFFQAKMEEEDMLFITGNTLLVFIKEDLKSDTGEDKKHFYTGMNELEKNEERRRLEQQDIIDTAEENNRIREQEKDKDDWMDGDEDNYWNID